MPKQSILTNREVFVAAVESSESITETLQKLGLRAAGGNYKQVHKYCELYGIDSPTATGAIHTRKANEKNTLPDEVIFCRNSNVSRNAVRKRLRKRSDPICSICKIEEWLGKPLVVQIDHINGIHNDNRLENLRWLCPNCHSQTETWCSRNKSRGKKEIYRCGCGNEILKESKNCNSCKATKIDWPSAKELERMLATSNFSAVGRKLGVSDNAIRKHLRRPESGFES